MRSFVKINSIALTILVISTKWSWSVITLTSSTAKQDGGANTVTTSNINCTGANFIAIGVATTGNHNCDASAPTDSQSNSYSLAVSTSNSFASACLWYKQNASVSSSMNFTETESGSPTILVQCYSNVATSGGVDVSSASLARVAALTPNFDNEVIVCFVGSTDSTASDYVAAIPFTSLEGFGNGLGGSGAGSAYDIQTTATNASCSWLINGASTGAVPLASFKLIAAATATGGTLPLMGI